MVEFAPNSNTTSAPDGLLHTSSKLKNSEPLDSFDSKAIDYSFVDSFLDYDSFNDWFDELTSPNMVDTQKLLPEGDAHLSQSVEKSVPVIDGVQSNFVRSEDFKIEMQASGEACNNSTDLNSIIEEGMSKVSLVLDGGCTSKVELESEADDGENDVESEGTSSISTSSSSSSGGSSDNEVDKEEENSSSSSSSDYDDEEEEYIVEAEGKREIGELEEGEIRDADGEDEEASADDMVAWDNDGEDLDGEDLDGDDEDLDGEEEEARAEGGPITSKNELKVHFLFTS
ncbi:hypothetical protein IC582_025328 [Cucumis melo]